MGKELELRAPRAAKLPLYPQTLSCPHQSRLHWTHLQACSPVLPQVRLAGLHLLPVRLLLEVGEDAR